MHLLTERCAYIGLGVNWIPKLLIPSQTRESLIPLNTNTIIRITRGMHSIQLYIWLHLWSHTNLCKCWCTAPRFIHFSLIFPDDCVAVGCNYHEEQPGCAVRSTSFFPLMVAVIPTHSGTSALWWCKCENGKIN